MVYTWYIHENTAIFVDETSPQDHTYMVDNIKPYGEDRIVTSSTDETLKIWNLQTNQCEHTLDNYLDDKESINHDYLGLNYLLVEKNYIISGSIKGSVKIWKNNLLQSHIEEGDDECIDHILKLPDGRLIIKMAEGPSEVWNLKTKECEMKIPLENDYILNSIILNDNRILIVISDQILILK